jgi:hypothetical protein
VLVSRYEDSFHDPLLQMPTVYLKYMNSRRAEAQALVGAVANTVTERAKPGHSFVTMSA